VLRCETFEELGDGFWHGCRFLEYFTK
jgi:hypothetical protein